LFQNFGFETAAGFKTSRVLKLALVFIIFAGVPAGFSEELRVLFAGSLEASQGSKAPVSLPYNGSALIFLGEDRRFFRGIELEIAPPPEWLFHQGSLVLAAYAGLSRLPPELPRPGAALDIAGERFLYDPLPGKLQIVYQVPLREGHGLRSNPYTAVSPSLIPPSSFPILFRLLPAIKGIDTELEQMRFRFSVKPVLGDEGAVRINFRYPKQLPNRPFTLLIDNHAVALPVEELFLKEGEHHLHILSDDYRNEDRFFLVERARVLDLSIELQDPAPLLFFEAPAGTAIFLDGGPVEETLEPVLAEPGPHVVRFQMAGYSITKNIQVQRGKTYHIVVTMDVELTESD
jgi:hypothetical protein